mmetsp:Transcript_52311/g.144927  ORF Transcript_52311/g.144927 Transcript_52311/m.144927 type:complete len:272 (+) Transcript_52311:883-1698(+)
MLHRHHGVPAVCLPLRSPVALPASAQPHLLHPGDRRRGHVPLCGACGRASGAHAGPRASGAAVHGHVRRPGRGAARELRAAHPGTAQPHARAHGTPATNDSGRAARVARGAAGGALAALLPGCHQPFPHGSVGAAARGRGCALPARRPQDHFGGRAARRAAAAARGASASRGSRGGAGGRVAERPGAGARRAGPPGPARARAQRAPQRRPRSAARRARAEGRPRLHAGSRLLPAHSRLAGAEPGAPRAARGPRLHARRHRARTGAAARGGA